MANSKFIGVLVSFLVATTLAISLDPPPCNPAVHCHPRAVECTECNPSIDDGCTQVAAANQGPGICTDYARPRIINGVPDYTRLRNTSIRVRATRCINIMDVTGRFLAQDQYKYISAAPEGFLTCFDGFIAFKASQCYRRCNDAPGCRKIGNPPRYQKHPIRFNGVRCEQDCREQRTVEEVCPTGGENITDFESQVPEVIPVPPVSSVCCSNQANPIFQEVVLNAYFAETCCPDIPNGTLISDGIVPESDPTFRIFNIPISTYVNPITGYQLDAVRITNLEFNDERGNECCCGLRCTCYGDPHCAAFNQVQRSSVTPGIEFTMFREGPTSGRANLLGFFVVNVTNGPMGIAEQLTIKLPSINNFVYKLHAAQAHANCWERISLVDGSSSFPPQNSLPHALTDNFRGTQGLSCPAPPATNRFRAENSVYSNGVNVYYRALKHRDSNFARFDIDLTRYVEKKEECCPAPNPLLEQLEREAPDQTREGFCYDPNGAEINSAFNDLPTTSRLLQLVEAEDDEDIDTSKVDAFCYKKYCSGSEDPQCVANCMNLARDFGLEKLADELSLVGVRACSNADDSQFTTPLGPCESGLTLEAAEKGTTNWQFVRAYPGSVTYCDDTLEIPFKEGEQLTFQYNGETVALDNDVFNIRFVERTDIEPQCNPCATKGNVLSLQIILDVFLGPNPSEPIICPAPDTCIPCSTGR